MKNIIKKTSLFIAIGLQIR